MGNLKQKVLSAAEDEIKFWSIGSGVGSLPRSLAFRCIVELGDAAADLHPELDEEDFQYKYLEQIIELVTCMSLAANQNWPPDFDFLGSKTKYEANFWHHQNFVLTGKTVDSLPNLNKHELENAVDTYLELPVRSKIVDRTLVDMLIAHEATEFARWVRDSYGMSRGNPSATGTLFRSMLGFLAGRGCSLVLFGLPIAVLLFAYSREWFSGDWPIWVSLIIGAVLLIETGWAVLKLPTFIYARIKANRKVSELLGQFGSVYQELASSGPISASHILDRVRKANDAGVVWLPPLFALLDDIIARGGRL